MAVLMKSWHEIWRRMAACHRSVISWIVTAPSLLWPSSTMYKFTYIIISKIGALPDGWLVACVMCQQHANVFHGWICSDNSVCCQSETEVADQTFYLTQSHYTDTRLTSPGTDHIMPSACQGSHWSTNVLSHWYASTRNKIHSESLNQTQVFCSRRGHLNH